MLYHKGYHFSGQYTDSNSDEIANFYHKMIEAFKWSYANTGLFGDPEFPTQIHGKNSVIQHVEGSRSEMNMQFVDQVRLSIDVNKWIFPGQDWLLCNSQFSKHFCVLVASWPQGQGGPSPPKSIFVGNFEVVGNFTAVGKTIPFCRPAELQWQLDIKF